jgi:hypothetical protein
MNDNNYITQQTAGALHSVREGGSSETTFEVTPETLTMTTTISMPTGGADAQGNLIFTSIPVPMTFANEK